MRVYREEKKAREVMENLLERETGAKAEIEVMKDRENVAEDRY
jgi:hypothetical protein